MEVASRSPEGVAPRFESDVVLKRDVFSTIERGHYLGPNGREEAILRRIDAVPMWTSPLAHLFLRREARALAAINDLDIAPRLLDSGSTWLVRSWRPGLPLNLARPAGSRVWQDSAKRALRQLHRAGITHNDLAKQQNWLVSPDGVAGLTDFQLAFRFRRRSRLFRVLAYEDLRHLLKHKRTYLPEALTPMERRILARKSIITRIWMATGKRVYRLVTRGVLQVRDREGGGNRLDREAPRLEAALRAHPSVKDVAIVAFPDRRSGTGLYAFVEASDVPPDTLAAHLARTAADKPPELLQIVSRLPRDASGAARKELLQLIAMNQLDMIDTMAGDDGERALVRAIAGGRLNLRDRFSR
jgi:hypothetical protein